MRTWLCFYIHAKGAGPTPFILCNMTERALRGFRLPPIATHEPVSAVAYGDDRKPSANEWTGCWTDAAATTSSSVTGAPNANTEDAESSTGGTVETDNMDRAAANDKAIRPFDMMWSLPQVRFPTLVEAYRSL
jgi:hypothetical protein